MKWRDFHRIRLMLLGFMAAIVLGDSGNANADFIFGKAVHVGPPISSPYGEGITCITTDGLEMYLTINRKPGGLGIWDIWVSKRETANDDWGEPENIGAPINTTQSDSNAHLSPDGLEMYFTAYNRPGGYGDCDTWVTRRATRNDPWGRPENLGAAVNTTSLDHFPRISPDGLELYFSSSRPGGYGVEDLWVTKRATKNDPWGQPINLGPPVNSLASEGFPSLSTDGLLLIFSGYGATVGSHRSGGYGSSDVWAARRTSVSDPWGTPVNLGPMVNTAYLDCIPTLSPDGHTLYFSSERPGGLGGTYGDIYQSPIIPIVDFNGDGHVDISDLVIMIDNWGTDESLCDIGPFAWGDGIVDKEDLEVLMSYWGQQVDDPTLIAHWKLDETESMIAEDSAGEHDGIVNGEPLWQPEGGIVNGAIELDGLNDYISVPFIPGLTDKPFSLFAWIKGGAAGQVVISQKGRVNWLMASSPDGTLATELKRLPPYFRPMSSNVVIADDQWHRVGLVWDKSNIILYVDNVEGASDTMTTFSVSEENIYIGVGNNLAAGSFFSGLIDDVRIYNRAITP